MMTEDERIEWNRKIQAERLAEWVLRYEPMIGFALVNLGAEGMQALKELNGIQEAFK